MGRGGRLRDQVGTPAEKAEQDELVVEDEDPEQRYALLEHVDYRPDRPVAVAAEGQGERAHGHIGRPSRSAAG